MQILTNDDFYIGSYAPSAAYINLDRNDIELEIYLHTDCGACLDDHEISITAISIESRHDIATYDNDSQFNTLHSLLSKLSPDLEQAYWLTFDLDLYKVIQ